MRTMTKEQAAAEIARAYRATQAIRTTEYMSMARLAEMVDLTMEEITAGVRHLLRTEDRFTAIPESNQKMLTEVDRARALWIGGQEKDLIAWT